MNIYTNTKKTKKFILVLVLLVLFNFCCPKQVKAWDFGENISNFFFMMEKGIINFLNDIFCDKEHEFRLTDSKNSQVLFTPENIIKGRFILFDANIFKEIDPNEKDSEGKYIYYDRFEWLIGSDKIQNTLGYQGDGGKTTLRNTISGWYYSLRNFAIVALLSVLVYVGIRMITSTLSQDKAKYKIMFKDWLVALCLLLVMHYIMIGVLNITSTVTEAIGTSGEGGTQTARVMTLIYNINNSKADNWTIGEFKCGNGTADCRFEHEGKCYTIADAFAYEFLLGGIILLTFVFAWKYLKREFTIIFLILLGPISCITYPIDKISDGKAQAFNKWLTEFIYNVLVQPFHLLLWTVLCGSAIQLANENVLYGLACLAMLIPAEKFVKEMFGFKDSLGSPLAAMATGAIGNQLLSKIRGGGSGKSSGGSGGSDNNTTNPNKIKNKDVDRSLLTDGGDESQKVRDGLANAAMIKKGRDLTDKEKAFIKGPDYNTETDKKENGTEFDEYDQLTTNPEYDAHQLGENGQPINGEDGNTQEAGKDEKLKNPNLFKRIKGAHKERLAEKYGTSDSKKIWGKRVIKGLRTLGKGSYKAAKGSLKVAGALGGATVGAAIGLLSGKGIAAGAGIGYHLTGRAINKAENKVSGVVSDYKEKIQTPEQREKGQKKDFMENKNEVKKAIESFKERNQGRGPTDSEFAKEMQDRYELKSYGMSDDDIDDSIEIYQEELQRQKKAGKSEEEAKKIAATKTITSNKWKKRISADKFTDPKTMQNALDSISRSLQSSTNCSKEIADNYARQYLINAGRMHGLKQEEIALPGIKQAIKVPIQPRNTQVANKLGVDINGLDKTTIKRMNEVTIKLEKMGYSPNEISEIASTCADSTRTAVSVIDTYASKVEFLSDDAVTKQSIDYVAASRSIKAEDVTQEEVRREKMLRLELADIGVKKQDMDRIRAVDDVVYSDHSQSEKQMALERAREYSKTDLKNVTVMDAGIKKLARELRDKKMVSDDGIKRATEIFERVALYKGNGDLASRYKLK